MAWYGVVWHGLHALRTIAMVFRTQPMTTIGTRSKRRVFTRQDVTSTSPGFPSTRRALTMASQCSGSMFQPFPFGTLADRKAYACPAVRPLPTQRLLILIDCPVPFTKSLTLFGFIISDRRLPDVADELITISPQSSDFFSARCRGSTV